MHTFCSHLEPLRTACSHVVWAEQALQEDMEDEDWPTPRCGHSLTALPALPKWANALPADPTRPGRAPDKTGAGARTIHRHTPPRTRHGIRTHPPFPH